MRVATRKAFSDRAAPLAAVVAALWLAPAPIGAGDDVRPQASSSPATRPAPPRSASQPASRAAARADPGAPNVVIFLIDTLRADRLRAYGYSRATSPALDALAAESVLFEQAYSAAPWTLPSVASLFTAVPPCEHATLTKRQALPGRYATLAEQLADAGYDTYSLFANSFLGPQFGTTQGFRRPVAAPRSDAGNVTRLLGEKPRSPFFLYIHNLEPHNPYVFAPPHTPGLRDVGPDVRARMKTHYKAYKQALESDFRAKRPIGSTDNSAEVEAHLAGLTALRDDYLELYDASVTAADARVGSVIELFKRRGWWENTLFIVLSDHGDEFGEHGGWLHDISAYEELLRVPLIIRFPKGEFAGTRVRAPVTLLDVLPTVLRRCGAALPVEARGRELLPLIRAPLAQPSEGEILVVGMRHNATHYFAKWKQSRGDINVAMRCGRWKGIWNAEPDALELYDLTADPHETTNLAAQQPALAAALAEHARRWLADCTARAQGDLAAEELDEEALKNLRALGYAE